jgi:hypothetical protein
VSKTVAPKNLVPAAEVPAYLRNVIARAKTEDFSEFTDGVSSGFGIISYRGKVWRVRKGGDEQQYLDENGDAMPSVEIVFLKANRLPSKLYYGAKYVEGDNSPPKCYSTDGVRPDSTVQEPVSELCAACPNNVWGSRITDDGKKSRACQDSRRTVVAFAHHLADATPDRPPEVFMLRVPPASLNPLKDFVEKILKPKGIPLYSVVVRVGFDKDASFPKFTFRVVRFATEEEYEVIEQLRASDEVARILTQEGAAAEQGAGGTTAGSEVASGAPAGHRAEAAPAAPPASPNKKAKPVPVEEEVEEEEEDDEDDAPPAPPVRAAAREADVEDDEDEEEAPPPPPSKKKAKPAPPPVVEEEEEEEEAPPPPKKKAKPAPPPVVEEDEEEEEEAPPPPKKKAKPAADDDDIGSMVDKLLGL